MTWKPLALRLHRWAALLFALPLLAVTATGLVLAVEPLAKQAAPPGTVTLARLEAVLDAAGPEAARGALFIRAYESTAALGGRGQEPRVFDLETGRRLEQPGRLARLFQSSRRLHETLLLDLGWLVVASTLALVLLAPLGLLLGWPRLRQSLRGWHQGVGWAGLPLLIGSPLTGLALAWGITLAAPPPAPAAGPPLPLREVLRQLEQRHGLDGLDWVRPVGGGARLARITPPSGTALVYRVTPAGLEPLPANWPRILHEGTWGGAWGAVVNIATALALLMLGVSGVWLWLRRRRMRAALLRARTV
ncbi:PepSY domain-containing protein [Roseococcus sp. DSY-14]|uniref:PepSY domain-containing protein n=1 Tax=Roseococcus sp. DSY-14 TaxID=3369650 RepID=UPI00387B23C2